MIFFNEEKENSKLKKIVDVKIYYKDYMSIKSQFLYSKLCFDKQIKNQLSSNVFSKI